MGWDKIPLASFSKHYVFERGVIPAGRRNRLDRAIWAMDGGFLHLTCADCGRINRIDHEFRIVDDHTEYNLSPCIICDCGSHIWVNLKDWEKEEKRNRGRYLVCAN